MPEKRTTERAKAAKRAGKSASTQAGEFVREEIEHVREGKHGARSTKQAIAIGLSKARRAGVPVRPGKRVSPGTRRKAERDLERGGGAPPRRPSRRRGPAVHAALEREGGGVASREELSEQGRRAARKRTPAERSAAARKAARTKAPAARKQAARNAAATRRRRASQAPRAKRTPQGAKRSSRRASAA